MLCLYMFGTTGKMECTGFVWVGMGQQGDLCM